MLGDMRIKGLACTDRIRSGSKTLEFFSGASFQNWEPVFCQKCQGGLCFDPLVPICDLDGIEGCYLTPNSAVSALFSLRRRSQVSFVLVQSAVVWPNVGVELPICLPRVS